MVRPENVIELKYDITGQSVTIKLKEGYLTRLVYAWVNNYERLRQFKDLMISLSGDVKYDITRGFLSYQGIPIKGIDYKTGGTIKLTAL